MKAQPERIYALLVEANLVPDPDEANAIASRHRARLELIRPGAPTRTSVADRVVSTSPRTAILAPVLGTLVAIGLVITALLTGPDPGRRLASTPETEAVARAEASLQAISEGRIDDLAEIFGAELTAGDRLIWEFNAVMAAAHPREIHGCEVSSAVGSIIGVECLVTYSNPVYEVTGTADLVMPFQSVDGVIRWQEFRVADGSQSPFTASEAYAEYLTLNHPDAFEEACARASYTGEIIHNGHLALAPPCAELLVTYSDAVAAWVEAGRPGS